MKTYERIAHEGYYKTITRVSEDGTYTYVHVWDDGFKLPPYKTTIQDMGWNSLKDFLSKKKDFVLVH